jgi:hypothetical protein
VRENFGLRKDGVIGRPSLCRPCQVGAEPPRRAAGAFFSVSWASWASTISPLSRVDAVERKPCAQWSPPGPVSQPIIRSALFSVLTDIGTPSSLDVQQIADQRRAISAFGVGLAPSATESTAEVVQHEGGKCLARHRGAQWMGYA